jgi:hypothetical protein
MRCCLGGFAISEPDDLLDRRWFYFSDGRVHCALGLAREAMMVWLREQAQGDIFLGRDWLPTLTANRDKPPVVGSIVEQMVISKIASNGLRLCNPTGDITLRPGKIVVFTGRYPNISTEQNTTILYVPRAFYHRDVDMVHVSIENNHAKVFAFQITIAYTHTNSQERMLEHWHEWGGSLGDLTVELSFVWVTESDARPVEHIPERLAASGSGRLPAHDAYWISFSHVDGPLAETLAKIRPRFGAPVTLRSRGV